MKADKTLLTSGVNRQMRNFFAYLRVAFNKVDEQRLEEVGPDRLCAEWYYDIANSISNSYSLKKSLHFFRNYFEFIANVLLWMKQL